MRSGTFGRCLGAAIVALVAIGVAWSQESLPPGAAKDSFVPNRFAIAAEKPAAEKPAGEKPNGEKPNGEKHDAEKHESAEEHEHEHHEHEQHEDPKIFVSGEYLLLQPRRRSLDFAIIDPNRDGKPSGNIASVPWGSDSGFRIGAGYRAGEGWEIAAYYTYLFASNSEFVSAAPGGTLYATLTHPGFVDAIDTANAGSTLRYQVVDVEIGKNVECGESLKLWLGGGPRMAFIKQTLNSTYNGQSAFMDQVTSPIGFDGGGIRVGADGTWKVGLGGLGIYGRAFGSMLMGRFSTSLVESNNNGAAPITFITDKFRKVVPVTELGMGLSWNSESFKTRVGYQMTNWYGLVDSPDFVHDFTNKYSRRVSDLSLDGLNVQIEFDY
ncbi:MAG: hypothetical protein K2R98_25380 [Gemmataceae bacterium]|nr:hypothetical protein [Gemmataceae bacterium]